MRVIQNAECDALVDYGATGQLIPSGEYTARLTHYECAVVFKSPRVFLHFQLLDPGQYFGLSLFKGYRVAPLLTKPKAGESFVKNDRIRLKPRPELFLMICRVLQVQSRPDRVSIRVLSDHVLKIRVRTVEKNFKREPLPEFLRYSVVDDIISVEA